MKIQAGIEIAETITCGLKKNTAPVCRSITAEELGLKIEKLAGDTVVIRKKSPLTEFFSYLKGYEAEGENFVPTSSNQDSLFMDYFNYRKSVCVPKPLVQIPGSKIKFMPRPAPPKIVFEGDCGDDLMLSLKQFINYIHTNPKCTKEEFYSVIDEVAGMMPEYVRKNYPMIRPEIAAKADKLFKWNYILGQEYKGQKKGEVLTTRFFDKDMKEQALKEYVAFVEKMTGKKVLIGSPTRMSFAVQTVTLYNNPKTYEKADYILWGHGTGSSLADINDINKWRFTDTGESIYKFMEDNGKGKKFLVTCCEEDAEFWKAKGLIPQDYPKNNVEWDLKRDLPGMKDKDGNFMPNIGACVGSGFGVGGGVKLCIGGVRKILGTIQAKGTHTQIDNFLSSSVGELETVMYNL